MSPSLDIRDSRNLLIACAQSLVLYFFCPLGSQLVALPFFSSVIWRHLNSVGPFCFTMCCLQACDEQLGFMLLSDERTFRRHICFLWVSSEQCQDLRFLPFSIWDANIKRLLLQRTSCCHLNGDYFPPGLALGLVNLTGSALCYTWYSEMRVE